jgi:acyl carrier protein
MIEIMDVMKEGIIEIFLETGDIAIEPGTRLGDIPEWDSMNVVNLQTYLENTYPISIPLDILTEDTTIGELIHYIEWNMAKVRDHQS